MDEFELNKDFKNNPYKVPEGYFEDFDAKVLARLPVNKNKLSVWRNVKKWSIAASIFIASGIAVLLYSRATSSPAIDIAKVDISQTELENFQNNTEVSDDEFIELLNARALDSVYHLEVKAVSNETSYPSTMETIEEEYSPLDDDIEI